MKRFISVLVFILLFATIFSKSVFAQTESATPSSQIDTVKQQTTQYPLNVNADVPQNFHTYTQSVVLELLSAFSCQISGINPLNPEGQCLGADPKTGKLGFVDNKGGAIGFLADSINMTYQIPISSGQYVAVLTDRFGIAKPAIAQAPGGYGFNSLLPILPLWEAIRNIVYIFFVLIFVFIGVGIMFRLHIDPRTVMTIQNSLPKIVMGLIFVTLSYAIAGFLVDMMYVSLYFTHGVVKSAAPNSKGIAALDPQFIQGQNPLGAVGEMSGTFGLAGIVTNATGGVVHVIKSVVGLETNGKTPPPADSLTGAYSNIAAKIKDTPVFGGLLPFADSHSLIDIIIDITSLLAGFTGFKNATQILSSLKIVETTPIVGGFLSGAQSAATLTASTIVGGSVYAITQLILRELLPNLIAFFIILGIVITALFRLWFTLIKSYLYILLHVVLAPFWIAFGLIPGVTSESVGFKPWIRGLIANLAVFPVTYAMILFAKLFLENIKPGTPTAGFVPPLIGTQDQGAFGSLFAIGVLLAIPEILNMVKKALKAPEGKLGQGISGAIGIGTGLTKAATAPATTRLIGHKNPMTGEFEGGLIPQAGKAAGRNIATGLASTGSKILPSKVSSGFGGIGNRISGGWKKYVAPTPHQAAENRKQEAINQQGNNMRLEGLTDRITDNKDVGEQQIRGDLIADAVKNHGITPQEAEEMKTTMSEESLNARMRELGSNAHNVKSTNPFQQRRDDLKAIAIRMQIKNANTMTSSDELLSAIREKLGVTPTPPPPTAGPAPAPEAQAELTQEAQDLIAGAKTGSIPAEITDEIRNILKSNGISEDDINTKELRDIIDTLASRVKDTDTPTT